MASAARAQLPAALAARRVAMDAYRRVLALAPHHPDGREALVERFRCDLSTYTAQIGEWDDRAVRRARGYAEFYVREVTALIQLRKYRALKRYEFDREDEVERQRQRLASHGG